MSERRNTPPPIPEEARANLPHARTEPDAIAMSRADEVMHVQSIAQEPSRESAPAGASGPEPLAPRSPTASPMRRRARMLALASGVLALVAALALSWRSFQQATESSRGEVEDPAEVAKIIKVIRGHFTGFSLLVDSQPAGAQVFVDGESRGRTPSLMNLQCRLGSDIEIRVEKAGYESYRHTSACEGSAIVSVKPKLIRAK